MKILTLTTSYPRWFGDYAGGFIHDLCKQLKKNGNEIKVIAPHFPGISKTEIIDDIQITRFQYMLPTKMEKLAYESGFIKNLKKISGLIGLPTFFLQFILSSKKANKNIDIIHAHWILPAIIGSIIKRRRQKLVLTFHGSDIVFLKNNNFLKKIILRRLKKVDYFTCVSKDLKTRAIEIGINGEKITVIPNSIDKEMFYQIEKQPSKKIGYIARLSKEKGSNEIVKIFKKINEKIEDSTLVILGDGPQKEEMMKKLKNYKLLEKVEFEGFVPREKIIDYLKDSQVVLIPSKREGFGMIAIESLATGTPVVAFKVGGLTETITDGVDGYLISPGEYDDFAGKSIKLINNSSLSHDFGMNGIKKIQKNYSVEKISKKYEKIYNELRGTMN